MGIKDVVAALSFIFLFKRSITAYSGLFEVLMCYMLALPCIVLNHCLSLHLPLYFPRMRSSSLVLLSCFTKVLFLRGCVGSFSNMFFSIYVSVAVVFCFRLPHILPFLSRGRGGGGEGDLISYSIHSFS